MLSVKNTASAMVSLNKQSAVLAAQVTTGNIIADRVSKIIVPKLPLMVKGYANTEIGKAVVSNIVAGVLIHTMPENDKAAFVADALIKSAALELAASLNIEEMFDELLDGITIPEVLKAKEDEF